MSSNDLLITRMSNLSMQNNADVFQYASRVQKMIFSRPYRLRKWVGLFVVLFIHL